MSTKKKRLSSILLTLAMVLALAMVLGLVPGMTLTAYADSAPVVEYPLWVGGVQVTSENVNNSNFPHPERGANIENSIV